jgi:hypothetical protein
MTVEVRMDVRSSLTLLKMRNIYINECRVIQMSLTVRKLHMIAEKKKVK